MLEPGIRGSAELLVTNECTARAMGSGDLPVLATPAMVALMEEAAWRSIAPFLPEGDSSVGCKMDVDHVSASPVGVSVRAETEVTAVEGKMITFTVKAYDPAGLIGSGTHVRAIVHTARFLERAEAKK